MEPDKGEHDADVLYQLALALLELLGRPVDLELELEHSQGNGGLALHGTLLRAFEPPFHPLSPTLGIAIGAHYVSIRVAGIEDIVCRRSGDKHQVLHSLHVLLSNGDALHIKVP